MAGVVPAPGATVWGAVYEISEPDLRVLDGKEGFFGPDRVDNHYNRLECRVYEKGDPNRPLQVVIYLAVPVPGTHPPRREYVDLIIGGARHWGLPADYIRKLEGFAEE